MQGGEVRVFAGENHKDRDIAGAKQDIFDLQHVQLHRRANKPGGMQVILIQVQLVEKLHRGRVQGGFH